MSQPPTPSSTRRGRASSGLSGILKLIGLLSVLAFVGLGILAVLDVIPRAELRETAIKLLVIAGIVNVGIFAIWVLMGGAGHRDRED
jgi:hypothetical protein